MEEGSKADGKIICLEDIFFLLYVYFLFALSLFIREYSWSWLIAYTNLFHKL